MKTLAGILTVTMLCLLLVASALAASEPVEIYVVRKDTLIGLCNRYLKEPAKWQEVARVNRMLNPDLLLPGQIVKVPVEMLKGMPYEATASFVKGDVKRLLPGEQNWQQVRLEEQIVDGTEISAGENSSLELTFEDGSSVLIHQGSRLKVISSSQGPLHILRQIRLEGGKLITRIKKATGRESRFEIETPSALAAARGTAYRVSVDPDRNTRTEVLESVVEVTANGKSLKLQQGEGALTRGGEAPGDPVRLLPPPQPLELPALFGGISNSIRFSRVEGAELYNINLTTDQAGKDVVRNGKVAADQPFVFQELADGDYYLFASSIGNEGLEGEWSEASRISLKRKPLPPTFVVPAQGGELPEMAVTAEWHHVVGAARYQLQLSRTADFSTVAFDSGQTAKTVFRTEPLDQGVWFFRIRSFTEDNYGGDWSTPLALNIRPLPPPAMAARAAGDGKLYLEWMAVAGVERYRLQLAKDESFSQPLLDQVTEGNRLALEQRPDGGLYYTRVAPVDRQGESGRFSQNGTLTIESDNKGVWVGLGALGGIGLILLLVLL